MMTPISVVKNKGFTLLEIMLVMSIIAMASILVVPNIGSLESRSFNAQARQASSLLNYARRMAVVSGQSSTIRFYADAAEEAEKEEEEERSHNNIVGEWSSEGIEISFTDSTDREQLIDDSIDITFYPQGGSSGGTLLLTQEERQTQLKINPFTGRLSNQERED